MTNGNLVPQGEPQGLTALERREWDDRLHNRVTATLNSMDELEQQNRHLELPVGTGDSLGSASEQFSDDATVLPFHDRINNRIGNMLSTRKRKITAAVSAIVFAAAAVSCGQSPEDKASEDRAMSEAKAAEVCENSWAVEQLNNDQNRIVAEGIDSIGSASTNAEARVAAQETFNLIKADPETLTGYANIFNKKLNRDTNYQASELHDGECFTEKGEQVAAELEAILVSSSITPSEAPADGYNTGVDASGNVVQAEEAGITGNRKAILVTLSNGEKVWIMERCANPVTEEEIDMPKGPTDQPKKPTPQPKPTPSRTPSPRPTPSKTPPTVVTPKFDDGKLPQNPEDGAAGQDKGTPSLGGEGKGPSGQIPDENGYVPGEQRPATPPRNSSGDIGVQKPSSETQNRPPAETGEDKGADQPSTQVPGSSNDPSYNQGGYRDPNSI